MIVYFKKLSNLFNRDNLARFMPFGAFIAVYLVVFAVGIKGIGGYWDWSFPYFNAHIAELFGMQNSSWLIRGAGTALSYSPDYYLRLLMSVFRFTSVQPEILLYLFLVLTFSVGSYGVMLICKRAGLTQTVSFAIAFAAFINPMILYKLLAGHINYFPSFAIFIFIIYFLLKNRVDNFKNAVILGALLAFVGLQIQFFLFAAMFIVVFYIFNRRSVKLTLIPVIIAIAVLINLPWLTNFIVGAQNAAEVSSRAKQISQAASGLSNFSDQLQFSFSSATHVSKLYPAYVLTLFIGLWVILLWPLIKIKRPNKELLLWITLLLLTMVLATGFYLRVPLGPLGFLTPMFREIGHFGPLAMLFMLLAAGYALSRAKMSGSIFFSVAVSLFVISNAYFYVRNIPTIDYSKVRADFTEFENNKKATQYKYRTLTYPFFGQYSFKNMESKASGKFLLNNVGYDNYMKYSGQNYLENAVAAVDVQNSPQFKLLKTYDLSVLEPYSVKYLYDFTSIYESNYDRYVPSQTYDNDISLVKNNPDFFKKLIDKNPGKIRKISPHTYEIIDARPIASVPTSVYRTDNLDVSGNLKSFLYSVKGTGATYTADNRADQKLAYIKSLFEDRSTLSDEPYSTDANGTSDRLKLAGGSYRLYANNEFKTLFYKRSSQSIDFFTSKPNDVALNGQDISFDADELKPFTTQKISSDKRYFIKNGIKTLELNSTTLTEVGTVSSLSDITLYESNGANAVSNPNFEEGLWQANVDDCNNYDDKPKIGMKLEKSVERGNYLNLSAENHAACTYAPIKLHTSKEYFVGFKFESADSQYAEYAIQYEDGKNTFRQRIPINNARWNDYQDIINLGEKTATRLYVYSREQNTKRNYVNYDNLDVTAVHKVRKLDLANEAVKYSSKYVNLKEGDIFNYKDDTAAQNLLASDKFTRGLWQSRVSDCGQYDNNPSISMKMNIGAGYDGSNALQLESKRHTACTSTSASVASGEQYRLRLNYKASTAQAAGYAVVFNDPDNTTLNYSLSSSSGKWKSANTTFTPPSLSTIASVFVYAYEPKQGMSIVEYSDIELVKIPPISGRYVIVQNSVNESSQVKANVELDGASESSRDITVKANNNFILNLGETYNTKWQIDGFDDTRIVRHWKLGDYSNGWYVNASEVCSSMPARCSKKGNTIEDVRLTAEFKPQSSFERGVALSAFTIVLSMSYLVYAGVFKSEKYKTSK